MTPLAAYIDRVQSEVQQGPVAQMTPAEIQAFLAEIRRGDQVLEELLSAEGKNSCPILESR